MQRLSTVPEINVNFKISSAYRSISHKYRAKGAAKVYDKSKVNEI